jgi:hypothetical protein
VEQRHGAAAAGPTKLSFFVALGLVLSEAMVSQLVIHARNMMLHSAGQ